MRKIYFLLGFFLVSLGLSAQSLLWQVEGPGGDTSYLFGTYHLLASGYLEDHPVLENKFNEAEQVVVEMVIDSSEILPLTLKYMMADTPLSKLISASEYEALSEDLKTELGMDISTMERFKPMMITTALALKLAESNTPEEMRYSGAPIDYYFAAQAERDERRVVALETYEEQMNLLMGNQTLKAQAQDLVQFAAEMEEAEELTLETIKAYQEADLQSMLELSQGLEESVGDMEAMVDDRNKRWIPKLKETMERGTTFIAVGALHLPGENGLLALLQKEGYKVIPLSTKEH